MPSPQSSLLLSPGRAGDCKTRRSARGAWGQRASRDSADGTELHSDRRDGSTPPDHPPRPAAGGRTPREGPRGRVAWTKRADVAEDVQQGIPDAALLELWDIRDHVAGAVGDAGDSFYLSVRGGRWTLEHHGVAYDAYRGQARAWPASDFCRATRMQRTINLSAATYTDDVAVSIARFWCARMQHFYARWRHSDGAPIDWAAEARSFVEPADIAALAAGGTAVVRNRIEGVRRAVPK